MIAREQILARLNELLREGGLARSGCSKQFLAFLAPLLQSGMVVEQRAGAGRRLMVVSSEALNAFIREKFPGAILASDATSRETGVGLFRDTKSFRSDTPEVVLLRAFSEDAFASAERPNLGAAAVQATTVYGVFSFLTSAAACAEFRLSGRWALVENPALFQKFERLDLPVHAVIYGRGRVSQHLLEWIKAHAETGFRLIHLPDYDPVGLSEHARLARFLGSCVQLHVPEDLEARFAKLSNPGLVKHPRSQAMLALLRKSENSSIQRVLALIERFNSGLEQEALLVDPTVRS